MCVHVRNIMFVLLLQQMSWQIKYTQYEHRVLVCSSLTDLFLHNNEIVQVTSKYNLPNVLNDVHTLTLHSNHISELQHETKLTVSALVCG